LRVERDLDVDPGRDCGVAGAVSRAVVMAMVKVSKETVVVMAAAMVAALRALVKAARLVGNLVAGFRAEESTEEKVAVQVGSQGAAVMEECMGSAKPVDLKVESSVVEAAVVPVAAEWAEWLVVGM